MTNTVLHTQLLQPTPAGVSFWNDETSDLHDSALRRDIPEMPQVTLPIQTVRGSTGAMIYLAYQVLKSSNKMTIMRAIASGVSCVFSDPTNYTGSSTQCVLLTGLDDVTDDTITDRTKVLETNFDDAEPVTLAEIDALLGVDADELAAYFGVLCLAGIKRVTPENRTAFNERRANAVNAQIIGDALIFIQSSPFLDDAILHKVYATFNSMAAPRCRMMALCASKMGGVQMGPPTAFAVMFMLLVDQGMGAIRIIKEAVLKYPWIRTEFPELKPELALANKAQQVIKRAPSAQRPFLKAIYGSAFVPLPYQESGNLVGICKHVLLDTTPTYRNYGGGKVTPNQEAKLARLLSNARGDRQVTSADAESVE